MNTEAVFSQKSEAKGRNGYFLLDTANGYDYRGFVEDGHPFTLDLYSKRRGDAPPIRLRLTEADAQALHAMLGKLLQKQA